MTDDDNRPRRPGRSQQGFDGPSQVTEAGRKFLRNKKAEWEQYRSEVTPFELRGLLPVL